MAALLAAALAPVLLGSMPRAQDLRLSGDFIVDPLTGTALLGFDPVAYFIDGRAKKGLENLQAVFAGKIWLFASNANRSAFLSNPVPYLPAFAGHDPVSIAAGFAVAGSPEFFLVAQDRIFLFRHARSRDAFHADRRILPLAEANWPQVKLKLVP